MSRLLSLAVGLLVLAGCSNPMPSSPTTISMNASYWNVTYSSGTAVHPTQVGVGWQLAFPTKPNSLHYLLTSVTMAANSGQTLLADVAITGNSPVFDYHTEAGNTCNGQADMRFMIERQGDNMASAYGRWWANPARVVLAVGSSNYAVKMDPALWSSVYGEFGNASPTATAGFADVLAHIGSVGFTFGGGCFFGHGVWLLSGEAVLTVNNVKMQ